MTEHKAGCAIRTGRDLCNCQEDHGEFIEVLTIEDQEISLVERLKARVVILDEAIDKHEGDSFTYAAMFGARAEIKLAIIDLEGGSGS